MNKHIIVFNAGSSSLKFSLFDADSLSRDFYGQVDDIPGAPRLVVKDKQNTRVFSQDNLESGHHAAIAALFDWIATLSDKLHIMAAGHRVVHGGREFSAPVHITPKILDKLKALIPLAPLHQPGNIAVIEAFSTLHPDIPQIACFDTAFHRTQPALSEVFALPPVYAEEGVIRYGFHGLSYQYIASVLPEYMKEKAKGNVIVAHLGNGASMCAMQHAKSMATTMGFTALDGLMMGTRCGTIDPGVILYLLEGRGMTVGEVANLLYKESGLKGVSGISHDMRELLESSTPSAKKAVEMFCYQAARQLAGLIPILGGLDAIVFTAGIGESSPSIREAICNWLVWLGITLDKDKNTRNSECISDSGSKVGVYVIPTNEELVITKAVLEII